MRWPWQKKSYPFGPKETFDFLDQFSHDELLKIQDLLFRKKYGADKIHSIISGFFLEKTARKEGLKGTK